MEELDLLKKDWNKNGNRFPKVSEQEIYAMLHKKSSSIVKWILLICIIEFVLLIGISYLLSDHPSVVKMEPYMPDYITAGMFIIDNGINLFFMYLFYVNYKQINSTANIKNLMAQILKTRKTVSKYIFIKLTLVVVLSLTSFLTLYYNDPEWLVVLHDAEEKGNATAVSLVYFGVAIVCIALFVLAVWLVYKLIYGLLLKRLNHNYQELKKMEI